MTRACSVSPSNLAISPILGILALMPVQIQLGVVGHCEPAQVVWHRPIVGDFLGLVSSLEERTDASSIRCY